jgi:hypothetical protein
VSILVKKLISALNYWTFNCGCDFWISAPTMWATWIPVKI